MTPRQSPFVSATVLAFALAAGCSKAPVAPDSSLPHKHHHHPPHAGTPVVLGDEEYHVELVLDQSSGRLQAYVLDSEMESFVRSADHALEITATVGGASKSVSLEAVPNPETGETVGDTALFEGHADWLRSAGDFDAVLKSVTIRGTSFTDIKFNFPKGNDAPE